MRVSAEKPADLKTEVLATGPRVLSFPATLSVLIGNHDFRVVDSDLVAIANIHIGRRVIVAQDVSRSTSRSGGTSANKPSSAIPAGASNGVCLTGTTEGSGFVPELPSELPVELPPELPRTAPNCRPLGARL